MQKEKSWGRRVSKGLGNWGKERFGVPSLTSVVTIRLRLATAPSKKRPRMRKQRRMMYGRNNVKIRIWPGGSGQKPEVRRSGDGGGGFRGKH